MGKVSFRICLGIILAAIAVLIFFEIRMQREPAWTVCYEMTNKHIEWTGAGYNGIYGRNQE